MYVVLSPSSRKPGAAPAAQLTAMVGLLLLWCAASSGGPLQPRVFWASQPVRPNETVLLQGAGLREVNTVTINLYRPTHNSSTIGDVGYTVPARHTSPTSAQFVLPADLPWPAAYSYTLSTASNEMNGESTKAPDNHLNLPRIMWVQCDQGTVATGWIRIFGTSLLLTEEEGAQTEAAAASHVLQQDLLKAINNQDKLEIARLAQLVVDAGPTTTPTPTPTISLKLVPTSMNREPIIITAVNATEHTAFFKVSLTEIEAMGCGIGGSSGGGAHAEDAPCTFTVMVAAPQTAGTFFPVEWYHNQREPVKTTIQLIAPPASPPVRV